LGTRPGRSWSKSLPGFDKRALFMVGKDRCRAVALALALAWHWDLKYISKLEEEGDSWFNAFLMGNKLGLLNFLAT